MHDRLCNAWFLRATSSHRCRVASLHTAKNMTRRFAASTEQEINKLFEDKDSESLKTYTKTAQEVFHERCKISLIAYSYLLFWKKIDCVSFEKLGTMSYQTSSKRSWQFWLLIGARKLLCFSAQWEGRTAATVWNWSGKTLSPGALLSVVYFSSCHIFPPV